LCFTKDFPQEILDLNFNQLVSLAHITPGYASQIHVIEAIDRALKDPSHQKALPALLKLMHKISGQDALVYRHTQTI